MGETRVYDMIVVGGGPGGYTAALYAARAGLDTLVLEKLSAGGQMALTEEIDNYPGYEDGIDGFTLAEKMQRQAERFGAQTAYAQVERMELTAAPKALKTSEGTFYARTVVLATGANPRELGLAGEEALVGRGVAYCAACDGLFISVGRKPATELVKGQLELDAGGYVTADETTRTNLPGVYAVGDVRTKPLRQVVTAVADGAMAVHMAEEYLAGGA